MSDIPARDPIDLRALITRIDRDIAETHKLQQETQKIVAEQLVSAALIDAPISARSRLHGSPKEGWKIFRRVS